MGTTPALSCSPLFIQNGNKAAWVIFIALLHVNDSPYGSFTNLTYF